MYVLLVRYYADNEWKGEKNDFEMIDIWQKNSLLPITTWHNSFEDVEIRNHHISQLLFVNCFMKNVLEKKIMVDQEKKNFQYIFQCRHHHQQKFHLWKKRQSWPHCHLTNVFFITLCWSTFRKLYFAINNQLANVA